MHARGHRTVIFVTIVLSQSLFVGSMMLLFSSDVSRWTRLVWIAGNFLFFCIVPIQIVGFFIRKVRRGRGSAKRTR